MRTTQRSRRPGPAPKPRDERRSILVGVKVSTRELGAFRSAARGLPVATWMRSRALEALEVRGTREKAETLLTQAKVFRDRADEVLGEMHHAFRERIQAVDRLLARAGGLTRAPAGAGARRGREGAKRRK